ncbi:MAG: hypothetical protein DBW67_08340 [SAR116 cluster bacterium]|nr:hypothetical protein [Paracoccaceae bacterium]RCL77516.1 MAG: hypothetical protein DBW67_08340 [SAR116 cluster bacterium]RPF78569.1 MAG: hypothetical protein CBC65_010265 [Rhodothermaceae bacterium TMED105]HBQ22616.1 hypothetical protein [Alphaproteobacteria bacterium]MAW13331.1 hypothetical protein [Paracoccaceae bacterium]|tara:strand:- start:1547 stop:1987 length:441 start_codon:yes stop_codon:yes gene_type:complete
MKLALKTLLFAVLFSSTANAGGHDNANAFGVALKVPAADIEKVEALLASHREFMASTHSVDGDKDVRLNSYTVLKGPEMKNPLDPSEGTTGAMIYILTEHYETPKGLKKHLEAGANWEDIEEMNEMLGKYAVGLTFPGFVFSKMNR